ncbi:hypothetical protein ES703_72409 [subsurface metagenome]
MLHPHRRVPDGYILYRDVSTLNKSNYIGAYLIWPFERTSLAIYDTTSGDGDSLQFFAVNQTLVRIVVGVRPEGRYSLWIIFQIFAAQQRTADVEFQCYTAFHIDSAGQKNSLPQINSPAAVLGAFIYRPLNGCGAQRFAVGFSPVVAHIIDRLSTKNRTHREHP